MRSSWALKLYEGLFDHAGLWGGAEKPNSECKSSRPALAYAVDLVPQSQEGSYEALARTKVHIFTEGHSNGGDVDNKVDTHGC